MASRRAATAPLSEAWKAQASCRPGMGHDPELWYPPNNRATPIAAATRAQQRAATKRLQDQVDKAKAICRRCPVQAECLDWAYTTDEKEGIWGGLTPAERGVTPLR
jgi:WhiB family redox-sensing transcriptional regulator